MRRKLVWTFLMVGALATPANAQDATVEAGLRVARLVAEPAELTFEVGSSASVAIRALDAAGDVVDAQIRVFGRGVSYDGGVVTATQGGLGMLMATVVLPADATTAPPNLTVPVNVTWPAIATIDVAQMGDESLYAGTSVRFGARALFANGAERTSPSFSWSSSDPSVANVDTRGNVTAISAGSVTISASFDGVRGTATLAVPVLSASSLEIEGGADQARQGDVLTFEAVISGAAGRITDVPVSWGVTYQPDDSIRAPGAAGLINDGKFVGEQPGLYMIMASAGDLIARTTVEIHPREAIQEIEIIGQGSVHDVHTSDLWIYEGNDGRDYAVTGTWGANG